MQKFLHLVLKNKKIGFCFTLIFFQNKTKSLYVVSVVVPTTTAVHALKDRGGVFFYSLSLYILTCMMQIKSNFKNQNSPPPFMSALGGPAVP